MSNIIKKLIIKKGVKNLRQYGFVQVTSQSILHNRIHALFFREMLKDNLGKQPEIDSDVQQLIQEIDAEFPEDNHAI